MKPDFEAIDFDQDSVIKSKHFECTQLSDNHDWHFHPECEITYIIKGSGLRFVADSVESFSQHDLVFIGPNAPHCWASKSGENVLTEIVTLQFPSDIFTDYLKSLPDVSEIKTLLEHARCGLRLKGPLAPTVGELSIALHQSRGFKRFALLTQILDVFSRQMSSVDTELLANKLYSLKGGGRSPEQRIGRVVALVNRHLHEAISQPEVAKHVNMAPASFSRFFKDNTGMTFISFVTGLRLMKACSLLVSTEQSITQIAFQCGFKNISNFNRQFYTKKKMTPSVYRQLFSRV